MSVRSVFQHFKNVQSVVVAIVDNVRTTAYVPPATSKDLSLDAWVLLRRAEKRSFEQAVGVWRLTLKALLEHGLGLPKA